MKPIDLYQENGYVILRSFFGNTEIAAIEGYVDRIYKKWRAKERPKFIVKCLLICTH